MTDLVFNPLEIECGFSVSVSVWVRKSFERQMEGKLHMWPLINDKSACDHFNFSRHLYSFFSFLFLFSVEPEIQVDKVWVHADVAVEVEISCIVHAEPMAEVSE